MQGESMILDAFCMVSHNVGRSDLRELVERAGAEMRFFCYWDNETGDRVPDVPDDIRVMMESLGGEIEIDEYR
jgi:hypothetical protein